MYTCKENVTFLSTWSIGSKFDLHVPLLVKKSSFLQKSCAFLFQILTKFDATNRGKYDIKFLHLTTLKGDSYTQKDH